jgi:hypothetical protein
MNSRLLETAEIAGWLSGIIRVVTAAAWCDAARQHRKSYMQSAQLPVLNAGEIMVHDASRIIGQVVETIYPPDNALNGFEQVLSLLDGTQRKFRLIELRPANQVEARPFVVGLVE